jgi:hypothetical protein
MHRQIPTTAMNHPTLFPLMISGDVYATITVKVAVARKKAIMKT